MLLSAGLCRSGETATFKLNREALAGAGPLRRVLVVFDQGHPFWNAESQLQAALTVGGNPVPCFAEFPLPGPDNRTAACISWRMVEERGVEPGDMILTLAPGRSKPVYEVTPFNMFPDPYADAPLNCGSTHKPNEWFYNGGTNSSAAEKTAGLGKSIRLENEKEGNWSLWFLSDLGFPVLANQTYIFSCRYLTDLETSAFLQVYYYAPETMKELPLYETSEKPRVFTPSKHWQMHRLTFTPPAEAGSLRCCLKFTGTGAIWVDDFALVPAYEPAITVRALNQESTLADRCAYFQASIISGRPALVPIAADKTPGVSLFIIKKLAADMKLKCLAGMESGGMPAEISLDKKGLIVVPLPGRAGQFKIRIAWKDAAGRMIAENMQSVFVRDGNVLDMK